MAMAPGPFNGMGYGSADDGIPVTVDNLGIPSEIKIIAPKLNDLKLIHNLPEFIELRGVPIPDVRIIGPEKPLPEAISIVHDLPQEIHIIAQGIPTTIKLDAEDMPRTIMVVPAPDFPSVIRLEVEGIPDSIQVTGFPKAIEVVHDIPDRIKLEMPDNPVITMKYDGPPIELALPPEMMRALSEIIIAQPGR